MEWSDLRILLAIAREGTLGAAARSLGQTQPTMGRRLRALESALGQTLFQRTSDGFVLTEEGTLVVRHAERMEQEVLAFQRELAGQHQELEGLLRLTSSDWFGAHVLPPVLAEFSRAHPRVTLELLTDTRFLSLARREADLAFRIRPFDEPDVVSRKLLRMPYGLYIKQGMPPPKAGDGAGASLITMDQAFGDMPDVAWLQAHYPNAIVAFRSNAREVHARLCAQGAGMAVLPRPLGDATPGIERIETREEPPSRDTWIGYHRDLRRLARLRALIDLVIDRLAAD
ncbi:LysR family transcriptional regulator [Dyella sp. C11]|uniref:LysR family transcriptional regulator n=1 Tax=Dyella sp. C11 TaxID=2126991 RepID=UPI000D658240|nr:LysR family transcriptional regulator [Dyella sp. C11]